MHRWSNLKAEWLPWRQLDRHCKNHSKKRGAACRTNSVDTIAIIIALLAVPIPSHLCWIHYRRWSPGYSHFIDETVWEGYCGLMMIHRIFTFINFPCCKNFKEISPSPWSLQYLLDACACEHKSQEWNNSARTVPAGTWPRKTTLCSKTEGQPNFQEHAPQARSCKYGNRWKRSFGAHVVLQFYQEQTSIIVPGGGDVGSEGVRVTSVLEGTAMASNPFTKVLVKTPLIIIWSKRNFTHSSHDDTFRCHKQGSNVWVPHEEEGFRPGEVVHVDEKKAVTVRDDETGVVRLSMTASTNIR